MMNFNTMNMNETFNNHTALMKQGLTTFKDTMEQAGATVTLLRKHYDSLIANGREVAMEQFSRIKTQHEQLLAFSDQLYTKTVDAVKKQITDLEEMIKEQK